MCWCWLVESVPIPMKCAFQDTEPSNLPKFKLSLVLGVQTLTNVAWPDHRFPACEGRSPAIILCSNCTSFCMSHRCLKRVRCLFPSRINRPDWSNMQLFPPSLPALEPIIPIFQFDSGDFPAVAEIGSAGILFHPSRLPVSAISRSHRQTDFPAPDHFSQQQTHKRQLSNTFFLVSRATQSADAGRLALDNHLPGEYPVFCRSVPRTQFSNKIAASTTGRSPAFVLTRLCSLDARPQWRGTRMM